MGAGAGGGKSLPGESEGACSGLTYPMITGPPGGGGAGLAFLSSLSWQGVMNILQVLAAWPGAGGRDTTKGAATER